MKKITLLAAGSLLLASLNLSAQNWVNGGNTLSTTGRFGTNNNYSVIFESNNVERGRLTNAGLWGFGTSAPNSRLHVNSSSGQDALRVQVNGSTKLYVHNGGGVSVGSSTAAPANGLFVSGDAGIGSSTPGPYKLKVSHGTYGLAVENASSSDLWELYTTGYGLELYSSYGFAGSFDPYDGTYYPAGSATSPAGAGAKTSTQAMPSILDKINQLKPMAYPGKSTGTSQSKSTEAGQYGFDAQEVNQILPGVVKHIVNKERGLDQYAVNYNNLGVVAIKGIQELQQTIEQQKQTISTLENRLANMEMALMALTNKGVTNQELGLGSNLLEQNNPNPFDQNTVIRYKVPAGANAYIMVYDGSGKLVKTLQAPASGQAQINANELQAGTYVYTLMVNGQVAGSKKMILSK